MNEFVMNEFVMNEFVMNETLWFSKWELSSVAIDRYSIIKIIIYKPYYCYLDSF